MLDCAGQTYGGHGCNGGKIDMPFDYAKLGLMQSSDYPYVGKQTTCQYDRTKVVVKETTLHGFNTHGNV